MFSGDTILINSTPLSHTNAHILTKTEFRFLKTCIQVWNRGKQSRLLTRLADEVVSCILP